MLTNKQRNILRAIGNSLEPILIIGKSGITANILNQLDEALTARELVKGRILPRQGLDVKEIAAELAEQTGALIVQTIGCNFILYRAPQDGAASKIDWGQER
ncbi:MAG: YhbY family RNA-binding protein [Firmicutes bacterium]|nr:YhbY family RNA-binding protein [Bacillota bacterium]